jgi:hypothetical protein
MVERIDERLAGEEAEASARDALAHEAATLGIFGSPTAPAAQPAPQGVTARRQSDSGAAAPPWVVARSLAVPAGAGQPKHGEPGAATSIGTPAPVTDAAVPAAAATNEAAAPAAAWIANFSGEWKIIKARSESLDSVLKLMGVPWIARKAADALEVTTVLSHDVVKGTLTTEDRSALGVTVTELQTDGEPHDKIGKDGKTAVVTATTYPAPPERDDEIGCMRILTVLPDGLGETNATRTLIERGRVFREVVSYNRVVDGKLQTATATRFMENAAWTLAKAVMKPAPVPTNPASPAAAGRPTQPSGSPVSAAGRVSPPDEYDSAAAAKPATTATSPAGPVAAPAAAAIALARPAPPATGGGPISSPTSRAQTAGAGVAASTVARLPHVGAADGDDPFFVPLSGTWAVDYERSASLDPLWRSMGVGWLPRLVASAVDIVTTINHSKAVFTTADTSGLGTHVQSVPLDGAWHPVRQVNGRHMLMRARQEDGAGDMGPHWLGHEIGFVPRSLLDDMQGSNGDAARSASQGRPPAEAHGSGAGSDAAGRDASIPGGDAATYYTDPQVDMHRYLYGEVIVETALADVEPGAVLPPAPSPTAGGATSSPCASPPGGAGPAPGSGAAQLALEPPVCGRLMVVYNMQQRDRLREVFTHIAADGTAVFAATRLLLRRETAAERHAGKAAELARLQHVRSLLMARRAAADQLRRAALQRAAEREAARAVHDAEEAARARRAAASKATSLAAPASGPTSGSGAGAASSAHMHAAYRDDGVSATDIWSSSPGEDEEGDLNDGACAVM